MAAGDVVTLWGSWNTLTQTNLDGLSSSATWVIIWESAEMTFTGYLDAEVKATIVVESASLSAGEIRIGMVSKHGSSAWPDVLDGTESTETISDTEIRDALFLPGHVVYTDTGASETYWLSIPSVRAYFGGRMPEKAIVWISQSTGTTLETTGDPNIVVWRGSYENVEAA